MFRIFRRSPSPTAPSSPRLETASFDMKALPILSASELLAHCGHDAQLTGLFRAFGMSEKHFDTLVRRPVHRFAEAVQLAPASENNHHCGPGGLLTHTLEVIAAALQIRRGYQLPIGASPDVMAQEEHFWTYGVFVSCLFHDIGKVLCRFQLVLNLPDGSARVWTPHDVPIHKTGADSYQIRFVDSPYKAHQRLSVTLFGSMLPRTARAWLMQNADVMAQVLASIWGDGYESGVIGEIVTLADRASTGQNQDITDASRRFAGAKESVADRLIQKLRQLLSEREIKLNQSGAMGWVAGEHTYFVCRPLAEKLIQAMKDAGEKGIPTDPVRIYDVLQEHGFALPYEDGRAIRKLRVEGEGWSHTLTCLKFTTRRLWVPVRLPQPFDGALTELGGGDRDSVPVETEAAAEAVERAPASESARESEAAPEAEPTPENDSVENEPESAPGGAEAVAVTPKASPLSENASEPRPSETAAQVRRTETAQETETEPVTEDARKKIPKLTWDDAVGEAFWNWLREAITTQTLPANNRTASVHYVEEGVFLVTPVFFQDFCARAGLGRQEFVKLQKRFCRLKVHKKTERTHHNVHPYVVQTSNRTVRLNGFLIPYNEVFGPDDERPPCNEYVRPADVVFAKTATTDKEPGDT